MGPRPAPSPAGSWLSASVPGEENPSLFGTEAQQLRGSTGEGGGLEAAEAPGTQDRPSGQGWQVEYSSSGTFSSPESWGLHLPRAKTPPPRLIPSTHPIRVPPFQARSHQVAGRSFQIKPFEMRQQQKQVREDGRLCR